MPTQAFLIHDGRQVHLGKLPPLPGKPVPQLRGFLGAQRTPPPPSVDFTAKAQAAIAQMYGNDNWGDCVVAGKMHSVGIWTGNETGTPVVGTTAEAVTSYHAICGAGDPGCVITDVLDVMVSKGLMVGGKLHKIAGYVKVDWTNQLEIQTAIYLFGALSIGINLPNAWLNAPSIWDVTNTQIVGGHDVTCCSYNTQGVIVSTWGGLRTITWPAFLSTNWLDECYVVLGIDWTSVGGLDPLGIDVMALKAALEQLRAGIIPDIPTPGPTPTPTPPTPTPTPIPTATQIVLDLKAKAAFVPPGIKVARAAALQVVYHPQKNAIDVPKKALGWTLVGAPSSGAVVAIDPVAKVVTLPPGVTTVKGLTPEVIVWPARHKVTLPAGWTHR